MSWIGEIRAESLKEANLIIVRRVVSQTPGVLDGEHRELYEHILDIFTLLQLSSIVYYDSASAVQGSILNGRVDIRQMVQLDKFYLSPTAPQISVTVERAVESAEMAKVWRGLISSKTHERFMRGAAILRDGYTEYFGQERIREFARAIEALIQPEPGKTTKQFKSRPKTFGVKGNAFERLLYESYEMRCDVEHVHAPDRFLKANYPDDQIETIAAIRTRQMEALARECYRRILTNDAIREHFKTEDTLSAFWTLDEGQRRGIWGQPIDVTGFTKDDEYNEKLAQLKKKYPEQWE